MMPFSYRPGRPRKVCCQVRCEHQGTSQGGVKHGGKGGERVEQLTTLAVDGAVVASAPRESSSAGDDNNNIVAAEEGDSGTDKSGETQQETKREHSIFQHFRD